MKFQPAQHNLARRGLPGAESASAAECLAAPDPVRATLVLLPAADQPFSLRLIHVAISLPELITALWRSLQGAVRSRDALGERYGLRGTPTPIPCHQHDRLRLIAKSQVCLVQIYRIWAAIARPLAGSACVAKSIAVRHTQRDIAS